MPAHGHVRAVRHLALALIAMDVVLVALAEALTAHRISVALGEGRASDAGLAHRSGAGGKRRTEETTFTCAEPAMRTRESLRWQNKRR
jgi:hypothetical protein